MAQPPPAQQAQATHGYPPPPPLPPPPLAAAPAASAPVSDIHDIKAMLMGLVKRMDKLENGKAFKGQKGARKALAAVQVRTTAHRAFDYCFARLSHRSFAGVA